MNVSVLNEAVVKLFTSCLVQRDHSVVKMKLFEIFMPRLHGLGREKEQQQKNETSSPIACWLMCQDSGCWGGGAGWRRPHFPPEHSWVRVLLLQVPDWMH